MSGVPGGDVTLHAAITAELARHLMVAGADVPICSCRQAEWEPAHVTDRVLAVLADRLPHTPADQLADLIGGTVHEQRPAPITGRPVRRWAIGPIHEVPDSPPAAPEPRQDT